MPETRTQMYPHRRNKDGSLDSICLRCFATVAHAQLEEELIQHEQVHQCQDTPLTNRGMAKSAPYRYQ